MHAAAARSAGRRPARWWWPRSTARSGGWSPEAEAGRGRRSAEVAKDAGFTGADAWLAKTTTVSRADAARQVALASRARLRSRRHRRSPGCRPGLPRPRSSDRPSHRPTACRSHRRAAPGRGDRAGGEGGPVQSRPAPPHRPPRDRSRRTRPEDRGRPRERAHPHRGASRPGEVLTDPARQRRRHHHRPLHHPRPGRGDARQGHRRDDRTPTDARARISEQTGPSTGGTAAASRSPSSSSTSRPTTCTPRPPPPWSSPSTTPSWPAR